MHFVMFRFKLLVYWLQFRNTFKKSCFMSCKDVCETLILFISSVYLNVLLSTVSLDFFIKWIWSTFLLLLGLLSLRRKCLVDCYIRQINYCNHPLFHLAVFCGYTHATSRVMRAPSTLVQGRNGEQICSDYHCFLSFSKMKTKLGLC